MTQQAIVFLVLAAALVLFILDRWRYDVVSLLALLTLTVLGIVPRDQAFAGFGHPAVVTVAAILVVSQGLANSGVVDQMSKLLSRVGSRPSAQVGALTGLVALCSAFMNNVGALALLMPVAVRTGLRHKISPSLLLMPLAFGSLLGGMTTLIGTPPNIIIGSFRSRGGAPAFGMFDFAPAGLGVAVVGAVFISLVGWRLIPRHRSSESAEKRFQLDDYTTELIVPQGSKFAQRPLRDVQTGVDADFVAAAIVRGRRKILAPDGGTKLKAGDHLIVEVEPGALRDLLSATGFQLGAGTKLVEAEMQSEEIGLVEAVVLPQSQLRGKTAPDVALRALHGLNLLGVSRQGTRIGRLLKRIRFRPGDVLLIQGPRRGMMNALHVLGCLPLAERKLDLGHPRRLVLALVIFGLALATLISGLLPAHVAFCVAALATVLSGLVTLRQAYESIDWPVIVLLGAMIPVGGALESSGGAALIAAQLASIAAQVPLPLTLGMILVLAMFLSDVMNNAATAVIMAPISVSVATGLGVSPDPFLMAVAVGASCAFLTPIGHQSNTLVMGPGGYRFGDYWRLGLPLEVLIVLLGVPLILWAWPP